jgi:hypothetical protein
MVLYIARPSDGSRTRREHVWRNDQRAIVSVYPQRVSLLMAYLIAQVSTTCVTGGRGGPIAWLLSYLVVSLF